MAARLRSNLQGGQMGDLAFYQRRAAALLMEAAYRQTLCPGGGFVQVSIDSWRMQIMKALSDKARR